MVSLGSLGLADVPYLTVQEKPRRATPGLLVLPALLGRQAWLNDEPAKSILPLSFVMQTMSETTPANRTWSRQPSSVENDPLRKWSALRASAIDLRIVR